MATSKKTNGAAKPAAKSKKAPAAPASDAVPEAPQLDPEVAKKIEELRATLRENFGKAVMALMMVPRYRTQMLGDLQHIVLDPMDKQVAPDMAGFAIWASVSEEVDAKIREQIANGVFPVRLKNDEWNSGKINWLLDVIASDRKTVGSVLANFRNVAKEGTLRLHPLISRLVDPEVLEKMGAQKNKDPE